MKKKTKKLGLTRETLTHLTPEALEFAGGQTTYPTLCNCPCQESNVVCSVMHTCVSCNITEG